MASRGIRHIGNLQNQVLQQEIADPRAEARPAQAVEDQIVKDPLNVAGGEHPHHASRRQQRTAAAAAPCAAR